MDVLPIRESVKIFLSNNKDNLLKTFSDPQIRAFYDIFEQYSDFFEESGMFLTPINIIKSKDNVEEKIKEKKQQRQQVVEEEVDDEVSEESDEDIKALFEE